MKNKLTKLFTLIGVSLMLFSAFAETGKPYENTVVKLLDMLLKGDISNSYIAMPPEMKSFLTSPEMQKMYDDSKNDISEEVQIMEEYLKSVNFSYDIKEKSKLNDDEIVTLRTFYTYMLDEMIKDGFEDNFEYTEIPIEKAYYIDIILYENNNPDIQPAIVFLADNEWFIFPDTMESLINQMPSK